MGAATVERDDGAGGAAPAAPAATVGTVDTVDIRFDAHVLVLAGDLDVRSTGVVRAAVHGHLEREGIDRTDPVVIDISKVTSVDATALKVLAAASRQAQRYGVRLVLRGACPAVLRMLYLTHLIRLVEVERVPAAV